MKGRGEPRDTKFFAKKLAIDEKLKSGEKQEEPFATEEEYKAEYDAIVKRNGEIYETFYALNTKYSDGEFRKGTDDSWEFKEKWPKKVGEEFDKKYKEIRSKVHEVQRRKPISLIEREEEEKKQSLEIVEGEKILDEEAEKEAEEKSLRESLEMIEKI